MHHHTRRIFGKSPELALLFAISLTPDVVLAQASPFLTEPLPFRPTFSPG